MQNRYTMEVEVQPSDIDQLNHVNNVVYLKWVQEIATKHWYNAATQVQQEKLLWVVAKHEIEYKRPAVLGDTIVASTWIGEATKRFFTRYTDFHRKSDGKLLANVLTLWSPVDMKTKRAIRVDEEVYALFSSNLK